MTGDGCELCTVWGRGCTYKKKNIKHVRGCGETLDGIADKFALNKKVFDSELRSALRRYGETMQKTQ